MLFPSVPLARLTAKPEKKVVQEVMEAGLKTYQTLPTKSAKAVLDLIAWAEENDITGPVKDVSTHHNKYAWEEEGTTDYC